MYQCGVEISCSMQSDSIVESYPLAHFDMMILNSKWNMLEVAWHASVPLHDVCKKSLMLQIVIDNHKSIIWHYMSMPHILLVVKVWLDRLNEKVMGDNEEWRIYDSGKRYKWLIPPFFCTFWIAKCVNIPPKCAKCAISPPKGAKTGGMRNLFSLFICKFWTFFDHLHIPPKWGDRLGQ